MPNAIMKAKSERRRPFIADQIEDCRDASGLFYILPFQKVSGGQMAQMRSTSVGRGRCVCLLKFRFLIFS